MYHKKRFIAIGSKIKAIRNKEENFIFFSQSKDY